MRTDRGAGALSARVTTRRGGFELDAAVDIAPGEVVAVLGPNGAGKSTLLGALAGLDAPTDARIDLGGRTLTDTAARVAVPPHQRRIGLLRQQALLFPHLSARDNVAFGPRSTGTRRGAARDVADRWLAAVDAAGLGDRRPAELSGGQAQRVAIARALATEPELLLLDEPFAALDVDAAPAIRSLLRRVVRGDVGPGGRGVPDGADGVDGADDAAPGSGRDRPSPRRTTLLVTHDVLDALVLADRVVVLADGRVVEEGPTAEVLARPRSPFAARIAGLDLVAGHSCAEGLRAPDGTVVGGVHPEPVADGEPAVALFSPASVAVHREPPSGSPRTALPVRLAALEPHGELVRLRAAATDRGPAWVEGLAADVTPAAVAELDTEPGDTLWFAVKAAEVAVHPRSR